MTMRNDDPRNDLRGLDMFDTPTLSGEHETLVGIDAADAIDAFSTPRAAFGDLGSYGITSAELPAITPEQAEALHRAQHIQRDAWKRAQQAREASARRIAWAQRTHHLSPVGYDLLQDELSAGFTPDFYEDSATGQWLVWSDHEQRRYTLGSWERHAQDLLPVSHPERETHILRRTPSLRQAQRPAPRPTAQPTYNRQEWTRPWSPALDSGFRNTPTPQMRRTTHPSLTGMPAGFGVAAPATVPLLREEIDPEKRGLC